jgi:hypothetical protein
MVELLAFLLLIQTVPVSKLGPLTEYLDLSVAWFFSVPPYIMP